MKKIFYILFLIFNLFCVVYLLTPIPNLVDLPNSAKSDEPGDTIQLKNVSAYYTNLSRSEVISFYRSIFEHPFLIRLNHPPEYAQKIIRDTTQSYYLEEFIFPLKASVFINGFEWEKDVFTKPEKRIINKMIFKGIEYPTKITVKIIDTPIPARLLAFFTTEVSIILIIFLFKKTIFKS